MCFGPINLRNSNKPDPSNSIVIVWLTQQLEGRSWVVGRIKGDGEVSRSLFTYGGQDKTCAMHTG